MGDISLVDLGLVFLVGGVPFDGCHAWNLQADLGIFRAPFFFVSFLQVTGSWLVDVVPRC